MAEQQDQGAVAPATTGQVAPALSSNEQHDDGAVNEVQRAEAELHEEVARRLAAQPVIITPAKKS